MQNITLPDLWILTLITIAIPPTILTAGLLIATNRILDYLRTRDALNRLH